MPRLFSLTQRTRPQPLPDDHAKVCWLGSGERVETEPNAELRVLDRAFLHGDVVARASDALGQTGNVTAVNVDVDLRFQDGTTVRHVSTKRLTHGRNFRPGHYAAHDNWVGRIEEVSDDVHLRFEDGSECVVRNADPDRLIPAEHSSLFPDEEQCPYFPGLQAWDDADSRSLHNLLNQGLRQGL